MPDIEDGDAWTCPRCAKRHKGTTADCNPANLRDGCANCIVILLVIIGVLIASIG